MATAISISRKPVTAPTAWQPRELYRFSVDQYHRLIETGILTADDRVELLEGWIVEKMSRNPPHDSAVSRMNRLLSRLLPDDWTLRVQSAITLRGSEPEPDFAIARGPDATYDRRKPVPRDLALVIEVADSSLLEDRRVKTLLYARARISEYWLVNLPAAQVEVYTQPKAGKSPAYHKTTIYQSAEAVPLVLDGQEIGRLTVANFLPR